MAVGGVAVTTAAAHEGDKAQPRIAAAASGAGLERRLTVRLTDADGGGSIRGAAVTARAEMRDPHVMRTAPWRLRAVSPGVYQANVRFVMPGRWAVAIAVEGEQLVAASSKLTVDLTAAASPPALAPTQLQPLPTRIDDRLQGSDVLSIAVLWFHAITAGAWMLGVIVMALALTARPGILAEGVRMRLRDHYREWGALFHWSLVPAIVFTGIYNMLYVTPFRLVWRPDELSRLADIPYGVLYETILLFKLALFALLLITGTQLLLRTVHGRPSAFARADGGQPSFGSTLVSALGPAGVVYLLSVPLILGLAASLRYVHVLSHVAEVIGSGS